MRIRTTTVRLLVVAGAASIAALAPISGAGAAAPKSAKVTLRDIGFHAQTVRIHVGQHVTWTWKDPYTDHNIHSVGKPRFKGATARQTGSYTVRFTHAGTYRYECTIHPGMTGKVIVKKS